MSGSRGVNRSYCSDLVKKAFQESGEDFENPTKEGIINIVGTLAEFARKFCNSEIIHKRRNEIQQVVVAIKSEDTKCLTKVKSKIIKTSWKVRQK